MSADLSLPLREAIHVPEQVHADDFVLQLHRGVSAEERTLADYVVTDAIAASFDEALGLVQSAVTQSSSKGAFIHGSFGSGKSHFMAVMHLLLSGSATARALPGLQPVVAKYEQVLDKRYLAVDYHLLGKKSFEEALFTGYLDAVRQAHPDAPLPVLHKSDAILADAEGWRKRLGDKAFLAELGGADEGAAKWGKRATTYTLESYERAAAAPPDNTDRQRLVRALVSSFTQASVSSGEWLEISQGLRAMTAHAKALRYDGITLFLDELVLWLGQHLGDMSFIQAETSKVAKLVESEMGTLPVPLISFVARQRDLKDFLGGSAVGAEQVSLGQSFQWWEDRFDKLTLQATDLPQIVQRRLLRPVDETGASALQAALTRVKANPAAWRYLLDDEVGSGEVDFAQTYPFSPALVDAMIALSSLMQRERTALKLMSELLAAGRDELTVADVIPVGDLFDAVVLGDAKPLTDDMKRRFEHARAFYLRKLRPYLLAKHQLTDTSAKVLPRAHPFRTEDRLAKTLLVAEIAPGAVSLKTLTAAKLAALNFGTVVSFVPGNEAQQVLGWVKDWAKEFGEVSITGATQDPVIAIQLSGVDYDSILDAVRAEDTLPNRRKLVRQLLLDELGVSQSGGLTADLLHTHTWRGSKRRVDLVFGNLRDQGSLSDQALTARLGHWKVAVDFPFDESPEHGPNDDVVRLFQSREAGLITETVGWVPHHLSAARMEDVGKLVLLDYVLTGDRFAASSEHLPLADREPARQQLDNQRKNLSEQLRAALRQAYGVQTSSPDNVGREVNPGDTFTSLVTGFRPRTPSATTLRGGLDDVLRQALDHQYPDHPGFEPGDQEVSRNHLGWTLDLVRQAASGSGRIEGVERTRANGVRRIASALGLGEMRENVYALSSGNFSWWMRFTQWAADVAESGGPINVSGLRARLRDYGMATDVEDLLILSWAALADRQFTRAGAPTTQPSVGALANEVVLNPADLPSPEVFEKASTRAEPLFGHKKEHYLNTASVARLAAAISVRATDARAAAVDLVRELTAHSATLGLVVGAVDGRLATAHQALALASAFGQLTPKAAVETLAGFGLPDEPQALAKSLSSAPSVVAALRGATWDLLDQLGSIDGDDAIRAALADAARAEEMHRSLGPALETARRELIELLRQRGSRGSSGSGTGSGAGSGTGSGATPIGPDDVDLDPRDDPSTVLNKVASRVNSALDAPQEGKVLRVKVWWE